MTDTSRHVRSSSCKLRHVHIPGAQADAGETGNLAHAGSGVTWTAGNALGHLLVKANGSLVCRCPGPGLLHQTLLLNFRHDGMVSG